ncbi:MAG: magnesium transporter, partial [Proteobacteria bacterium]|nr:magnesium transporter [Pseudomonadota bacterium]
VDIGALAEFDQQLSDRLQFLLDAVLGFINNNQNDIMKVLTIVSVVTIGPMTLAGIWGMNFKSIGEYDWPHGYAMALTAMIVSVVVPLVIFKWRKWF